MLQIADYVSERTLVPELAASSPEEALRLLVARLRDAGKVARGDELYEALCKREEIMSTGLGRGIALPHAWAPEVREVAIAVGRSRQGFDYRALDGQPVHLVFLLATPEENPWLHLQLLARLSHLARQEALRSRLMQARAGGDMLEAIAAAADGAPG